MKKIELKASPRKAIGKKEVKKLRAQGFVPAILYGPKTEPTSLSVELSSLKKALENRKAKGLIVELTIEGRGTREVRLKDLQIEPVKRRYLHLDFYEGLPKDQG